MGISHSYECNVHMHLSKHNHLQPLNSTNDGIQKVDMAPRQCVVASTYMYRARSGGAMLNER